MMAVWVQEGVLISQIVTLYLLPFFAGVTVGSMSSLSSNDNFLSFL